MKMERIRGTILAATILVCSLWIGTFSFTLDAVANEVTTYELTVTVVGEHGTVEPDSGSYFAGTVVTLTATPEVDYMVRQWTGTDDDTSCALTNTVTMDSDKTVTVEFGMRRSFVVPGQYVTIQEAIDAAACGDRVIVSAGVYYGNINFNSKNIIVASMNPDDPDVVASTVIHGTGAGPVVTFSGSESQNCMLDGLTITGGNTTGDGGGICGNGTDATIANCIITNNHADGAGGGVSDCNGTIVRCMFTGNTAYRGGGVGNSDCIVTIEYCTFTSNSASYGGGVYSLWDNRLGDMTVINSSFAANTSFRGGGAVFNSSAYATFLNCTFSGNSNDDDRGGALESNSGTQTLFNCTFSGNVGAISIYDDSYLKMQNCIVANDRGQLYFESENVVEADYCCIPDWVIQKYGGTGNFDADPCLIDPDGLDNIFGTEDDNLRLLPESFCIDAGDPNYVPGPGETDLDGNPRIVGDTVDMGVYEFQGFQTLYVDADAPFGGDGSSWATAFRYLQDALFNATPATTEIKVAEGIYKPDQGDEFTPGDREARFRLISGVTLEGGYAGYGEPDPNARDADAYETILSGDLNGDDVQVADACDLFNEPTRAENSYHVVTGIVTDTSAVLDGFTITSGNANGSYPDNEGGGTNSKATLTNCRFIGNAAEYGGGAFSRGTLTGGTLTDCEFIGNFAEDGGGLIAYGKAVNCTFIGNSASSWGGAMSGDAELTNCTFLGNSAGQAGGAILGCGTLINCLFSANSAGEIGGAVYSYCYLCEGKVINCTFSDNSAGQFGGAMFLGDESDRELLNSVFWGNSAAEGPQIAVDAAYACGLTISYCNIQGGKGDIYGYDSKVEWGEGNIEDDPLFVDADGIDNIVGTEDDNLRLLLDSPCIGTGDNTAVPPSVLTDLDGRPRIINGTVDMGAYEFYGPIYVDDDAPNDPGPGDPQVSDPLENGTEAHPFDTIQEGINVAKDGYTVLVRQGSYLEPASGYSIDFLGKNITLTSADPTDWDIVDSTIIRGYVQFSGTEEPNCTFTGFRIGNLGGAIYGNHTHATISHCNISGNGPCGATVIKDCDGIISNCLITDNTTFFYCGVYPVVFGCDGLIKNCTIANNLSGVSVGTATIENCIIYNNFGSQLAVTNGNTVDISYSNVQGGLEGVVGDGNVNWGPGNIDTDPCFIRLGYWMMGEASLIEGDYHLRSEGWRWNIEGKSWTYDYVTSRCVDAGNPGSPLRDELMSVPRDPNNVWGINLRINMGAYGGTSQASMPPHDWALPADLNNDGTVNFLDFAYQTQDWLMTAPEQPGDLNRDGVLNTMDLGTLAEEWLKVTVWVE